LFYGKTVLVWQHTVKSCCQCLGYISFDTDPDPAFFAEYRSGSGSNPDPGA
jgi:hypothetical protein